MANLTIDANAAVGETGMVPVVVYLSDLNGNRVPGTFGSGSIVETRTLRTDATGLLTIDLTPNASITPANTYYTVQVSGERFLVNKSSATQTLAQALAVAPADLGPAAGTSNLRDWSAVAAVDGQVPIWNATTGRWTPGSVSGAGLVPQNDLTVLGNVSGAPAVPGPLTSAQQRTAAGLGNSATRNVGATSGDVAAGDAPATAQAAAIASAAADATTKADAAKARSTHTGTQSADTLTDGTTNKAFLATERTKLTGIATGATANSADATLLARSNHTGTQSADTLTDGTTNKAFLATERTKLAGIATAATANSADATLLARANHTGTQTMSTISDAGTAAVKNVGTLAANVAAGDAPAAAQAAAAIDATTKADAAKARATHTGTQLMSTISDAGTAATKNVGTSSTNVAAGDAPATAQAAAIAAASSDATTKSNAAQAAAIAASNQRASNLSDVANVATARTNLGLTSVATAPLGAHMSLQTAALDPRLAEQSQDVSRRGGSVYRPRMTTAVVTDIVIGDSIARGCGGTLGVNDWSTIIGISENRAAGLIDPGPGLILCNEDEAVYGTLKWTNLTAGVTTTGGPSTGSTSWQLNAIAQVIGDTRLFRMVQVVYEKQATSAANIQISVDGGVTWTADIPTTGTNGTFGYYTSADLATIDVRTVQVKQTSAGTAKIVGYRPYQTNGTGLIVDNLAHGGGMTADWVTNRGWENHAVNVVPRRIYIALGGNDAFTGVSAATMAANLATIISRAKIAAPLAEIVVIGEYYPSKPTAGKTNVGFSTWTNTWIRDGVEATAAAANVTFIDLTARFGDCSEGVDPYTLTMDGGLHFGPNGQAAIADVIIERLGATRRGPAAPGLYMSTWQGGGLNPRLAEQSQDVARRGGSVYRGRLTTQLVTDIVIGDSIGRGDGSTVLGVTDWSSLSAKSENRAANLVDPGPGIILCAEDEGIYGNLKWANLAVGVADTGGPSNGTSSWKLNAIGQIIGDTRVFQAVSVYYEKQAASAANIQISTDGGGTWTTDISTTGSGYGVFNSANLLTNVSRTVQVKQTTAGTAKIIGYRPYQNAGTTGLIVDNLSHGGAITADFVTNRGWETYATLVGARRVYVVLGGNDSFGGIPSATTKANMDLIIQRAHAAVPLAEVVVIGEYYVSKPTAGKTNVGYAIWRDTWIRDTFERSAAENNAIFIDLTARFGDCSEGVDPYTLTMDAGLHFSDTGQRAIVDLLMERLGRSSAGDINELDRANHTGGADDMVDGIASHGMIRRAVNAGVGSGSQLNGLYALPTDTYPLIAMINTPGFLPSGMYWGAGGASAPDVFILHSGAAAATLTGQLTVPTPASGGVVANKTYVDNLALTKVGGAKHTVSTNAASGTAATLNLANGNVFDLTLTGTPCVITLSGTTASVCCEIEIIIRQDATGTRLITWPASVKWASATAPVLSTAASAVDLVTLRTVNNGTTWYGNFTGKGYA